jgi:hypothetical protein
MRANRRGKRKNALGGRRKPLIRLDSDKENPSFSGIMAQTPQEIKAAPPMF